MNLLIANLALFVGLVEPESAPPLKALDIHEARTRTMQALEASNLADSSSVVDWEATWESPSSITEAIVHSLAASHEPTRALVENSLESLPPSLLASYSESTFDPFLKDNLALWLADELIRKGRIKDAMELLASIDATQIAEPAMFHFLTASAALELSEYEAADRALRALARLESVPPRYAVTAELMRRSLAASESDALATIANDMRGVRRQLDLGGTDVPVQTAEKSILDRLDELIKELEDQEQNSAQAQSTGPPEPNSPAPDSRPAGGQGEGEVDEKKVRSRKSWGNLPAKDREKALQEIGRELPGPYRSAVEQYFRKLARVPGKETP